MPGFKHGSKVALINYGSGTCLDLTASNPENGTPCIGYNYNGTDNQHWRLVQVPSNGSVWPVWQLENVQTRTNLDLLHGGKDNGTQIVGWQPGTVENPHQQWRIVTAHNDSDVVMIQNVGTGTYVDLYNGNKANSTKIVGWAGQLENQNTHQLWKIKAL